MIDLLLGFHSTSNPRTSNSEEIAARICDRAIYLCHESNRLLQRGDDAAIVIDVCEAQFPSLSVFEPLIKRLVSTDSEAPDLWRYALKVLASPALPLVFWADVNAAALERCRVAGRLVARRVVFRMRPFN